MPIRKKLEWTHFSCQGFAEGRVWKSILENIQEKRLAWWLLRMTPWHCWTKTTRKLSHTLFLTFLWDWLDRVGSGWLRLIPMHLFPEHEAKKSLGGKLTYWHGRRETGTIGLVVRLLSPWKHQPWRSLLLNTCQVYNNSVLLRSMWTELMLSLTHGP